MKVSIVFLSLLMTFFGVPVFAEEAGSSIFNALKIGNPEILEKVLIDGSDPNEKDNNGYTPLSISMSRSANGMFDPANIQILLKYGANPNQATGRGYPPICYFTGGAATQALEILLNHDANPNVYCDEGKSVTALMKVALFGEVKDVELMIEAGAIDKKDRNGCSALALAAKAKKISSARVLAKAGSPLIEIGDCGFR